MATIFTKIVRGEIPCYKIAEDSDYFAFLDINPLAKGHTLVIPKIEEDQFFDLPADKIAGMMVFAQKIAIKMRLELECKRVAVVVAGLDVPHAHIHLIPLNSMEDINFKREKLKLTGEEYNEIRIKLQL